MGYGKLQIHLGRTSTFLTLAGRIPLISSSLAANSCRSSETRSIHNGSIGLQSKMVCDLPRHLPRHLQRLCEQLVEHLFCAMLIFILSS
jgi:hypothetical protein